VGRVGGEGDGGLKREGSGWGGWRGTGKGRTGGSGAKVGEKNRFPCR